MLQYPAQPQLHYKKPSETTVGLACCSLLPMPPGLSLLTLFIAAEVSSSQPWEAPYVASQAVVMDLVEIYFEIVYPIFPLFHRPTYIRKV